MAAMLSCFDEVRASGHQLDHGIVEVVLDPEQQTQLESEVIENRGIGDRQVHSGSGHVNGGFDLVTEAGCLTPNVAGPRGSLKIWPGPCLRVS